MKAFQIRFTDEEYDELVCRAAGQKLATYARDCLFGTACNKPLSARGETVDPLLASHLKWSQPIEVVPLDPTIEAQRQAKLEGLRKAQEMLIAKQKKPEVKRGASSSGYAPRRRGVEYNPLGEYDEPVIDVNT
jgi:hypothetical protein